MYCPNCGSDNDKNQNFCRFCGLNLTDTAKSLKTQLTFGKRAETLKKSDKIKRTINKISDSLIFMFFVGLALFVLVDASRIGAFFSYSAGTFFFFQILKWGVTYFSREKSDVNASDEKISEAATRKVFEPLETRKFLEEPSFEPIAAIVEDSTELLYVGKKTRKFN